MGNKSFSSRVLNRSFYYGFSTILGRVVGFIMLPIYTNYLTPSDYGVAGFLVLYVSLVQTVLGGQLEHSISKFHYDKKVKNSLAEICLTSASVTSLFCILPVLFGVFYSEEVSTLLFSSAEFALVVSIASINILFASLEVYGFQYLKILDRAKLYLVLNVLKLFLQLLINIVLVVYYEMGIIGIISSSAIVYVILTIVTFWILFNTEKTAKFRFSLVKPLLLFSAPLWLSGLLGLYNGSSHQVFIKFYSGLDSLGLYNLGATFGALVGALFLSPFFSFWQVERFRVYERDNAVSIFKNTFYVITLISLFLSLVVSIFSGPIISIMSDDSFHDASKVVAPLAIASVIIPLGWYLNFSFLVMDKSKELAKNSLIYTGIVSLIYWLIIPRWGYEGAAFGVMIATIINLHIIHSRARRFYDMGISIIVVDVGVVFILSLYYLFVYFNPWLESPFKSIGFYAFLTSLLLMMFVFVIKVQLPELYKRGVFEMKKLLMIFKSDK